MSQSGEPILTAGGEGAARVGAAGSTPPADLAQWRAKLRAELISRREAVPLSLRREWGLAISLLLLRALPLRESMIVGFCWPYRGEYDARPLLRVLRGRGVRCALPQVLHRAEPLIFRRWAPGVEMRKGTLGIAYPPNTERVEPDLLLVPLVGFGRAGDRLGYGGGYFDRTLASLAQKPLTVGVGFELARLESTFPQAHDVPMDAIVTEAGAQLPHDGRLVPATAQQLKEHLERLAQVRAETTKQRSLGMP